MKLSGTVTREVVLKHLKRAYGVRSLEEIDVDLLAEAVSAIQLARRMPTT